MFSKPDFSSKAGASPGLWIFLEGCTHRPTNHGSSSFLPPGRVCSSLTSPTECCRSHPSFSPSSRVDTRQAPLNWLEVEVHEPRAPPPPFLPCSHIWHLPSWRVVCTSTEETPRTTSSQTVKWVPTEAPPQTKSFNSRGSAFFGCSHHLQ